MCFLSEVTDDLPFNSLPPCGEDRSSIRDHFSAAIRIEGDASGDDGTADGVCVCVSSAVFDYLSLQESRSGDISLLLCTSVSSQMNRLFMVREAGELSGKELSVHMRGQRGGLEQCNTGTHEYHSGQCPCVKVKETCLLSWHSSLC